MEFFLKHYVLGYRGVALDEARSMAIRAELRLLVERLAAEPRVLCHRDYHSRNLMLHQQRLYLIDYQDARLGPDTYDLASLLRDSYVDLSDSTVNWLLAYFLALTRPARGRVRVPRALRRDVAAAQPQGARHVRLPDDRQAEPGVHPVHAADAALRAHQPAALSVAFGRLHDLLAAHVDELR